MVWRARGAEGGDKGEFSLTPIGTPDGVILLSGAALDDQSP